MSYMSSVMGGKSIMYQSTINTNFTRGYCASTSFALAGHAFTQNQTTPGQYDSTSAGVLTEDYVWLDYEPHTSATFGEVDVDTAYSISHNVKFLDPSSGDVWWAACNDLGADYYGGRLMQMADSGNLALFDNTSERVIAKIDYDYKYTDNDRFVRVRKP